MSRWTGGSRATMWCPFQPEAQTLAPYGVEGSLVGGWRFVCDQRRLGDKLRTGPDVLGTLGAGGSCRRCEGN